MKSFQCNKLTIPSREVPGLVNHWNHLPKLMCVNVGGATAPIRTEQARNGASQASGVYYSNFMKMPLLIATRKGHRYSYLSHGITR
eukprot:snap_masked-scaffold_21-processed-gene-3.34-mRNA-1 protein AED:1.00 eAED:1.00 QI:0/0/0/0/1/1/2/0/85